MKNLVLIVACATLLGACASARKTYLPDGRLGYAVQCSNSDESWTDCYRWAGNACGGRGFDVYYQDNQQNAAAPAPSHTDDDDDRDDEQLIKRGLIVACRR